MTEPQHPADPAVERRLADAFAALATTEVPASAPRPQQAPRPAGSGRGPNRRRWAIGGSALIAVAAAVVLGLVLGNQVQQARKVPTAPPATQSSVPTGTPTTAAPTTGSTPTDTGTPTTGDPAAPDPATVQAAFEGATAETRSAVVTVPGGWEGADLVAGTIRFWSSTDGITWQSGPSSTYPADARGDGQTVYSATIRAAALLTGMEHATFLVFGEYFTGDATGFVIDYTDGPNGWGAVKAGSDGNLHPSGAPVDPANQIGLMYAGDLVNGLLQTVDCNPPTDAPLSSCTAQTSVVKNWRWDGTQFVLAS